MNKHLTTTLSLIASVVYRIGHVYRHFASREIWRQFRLAGARYQTSAILIAFRALLLYRAGRFLPEESLTIGLLDPSAPLGAHENHFSDERLNGLQDGINSPHSAACRDKMLFHAYCRSHSLPTADLLGIVSSHGSRTESGKPLVEEGDWIEFVRNALPPNFIAKPRTGNKGREVKLMGLGYETDEHSVRSLARELRALEQVEDFILEKRINLHQDIARLTGSSHLSCIRVVSVINKDGIPEILAANFRLIVGDSITDNISDCKTGRFSGNVFGRVDPVTGLVVEAWMPDLDGIGCRSIKKHPATDLDIVGFSAPFWRDVRKTVCTAAIAFLPIRTVGWDVAITPDGPVLVEANERYQFLAPDHMASQLRPALLNSLRHKG